MTSVSTKTRRNNRAKIKNLFVLGAGASYSATLPYFKKEEIPSARVPKTQTPLDKQFTSALLDMDSKGKKWVQDSQKIIKDGWIDHIPFRSMGLEEAIQSQAANTEFLEKVSSEIGKERLRFDDYMNHLVHLIAFRLKQAKSGAMSGAKKRIEEKAKSKKQIEEGKEERALIYEAFVNKYFGKPNLESRIITFNYDDVLDTFLLNMEEHQLSDIYSTSILPNRMTKIENGGEAKPEKPLLLKLHGSVNWNCMSDDFKRIIRSGESDNSSHDLGQVWLRKDGCPETGDEISPCIIPPIPYKPVTRFSVFRNLWEHASKYLHECEELYICGYSLPPTDSLAASLFKNFSNNGLKKVTVIDPDAAIMTRWLQMLTRNNVSVAEWMYYPDFKEFVIRGER